MVLLARRAWTALTRRLSGRGRVTLLAFLLIGTQLLFRTWATAGSWFMWDDYIFLGDVALGEDDMTWLFHSHFNLLMPASFLLVKLVGAAGLTWGVIATQMLILQLLASIACWWMLRTLFGDRRLILIPLAFYLASPLTMPASLWWSVAINQLPHHIAIFGAIAAHVTYLRSRRLVHLALAFAFLLLGFASYVKTPLLLVVLVALAAMWFTAGPWRARLKTMASWWPAWALYALSAIVYFLIWLGQQTTPEPRQICELPGTFKTSISETVGTALLGGPWNFTLWTGGVDPFIAASKCVPVAYRGDHELILGGAPQSLASPALFPMVLSWVVLIALMIYRWSRHRHALMSLWFMVPYIAGSAVFVYAGRAGVWGSQVSAREIRYFADIAAVAALALGTALLPIAGSRTSVERRERPYLLVQVPKHAFAVFGGLFLVGAVWSSISYAAPWHETRDGTKFPERVFINEVRTQIAESEQRPVLIADVPLPAIVATPALYPDNLPSRKLAPLAPELQAVRAGTDLSILDVKGRIREAWVPKAPRADPGPVEGCGYLVQKQTSRIAIAPVADAPWWVRIDYLAGDDGTAFVRAGDSVQKIAVEKGLHSMFLATTGAYDEVLLRTGNDITLCVDNVHVGGIEPKLNDRTP
ncbi:hypothetical protein [Aeromicrobium sp. P5_D10]